MTTSVLDLFTIGIGPSSSHTVGPMRAAHRFATHLADAGLLEETARVRCELFGSLGATGHGHGSVPAVVLGLAGEQPHLLDPAATGPAVEVPDVGASAPGGEAGGRVRRGRRRRAASRRAPGVPQQRDALHRDRRGELDTAIRTMRDTGADMSTKYKETARGGLALTVVAC